MVTFQEPAIALTLAALASIPPLLLVMAEPFASTPEVGIGLATNRATTTVKMTLLMFMILSPMKFVILNAA
jgi:hypothetical protein